MTRPAPVDSPPAAAGLPELRLEVYASPVRAFGDGDQTWAPTTSTLVYGDSDAVLVDAQFLKGDVDALIDMVDRIGRRLTTIFVTHAHGDHYYGSSRIASRFGDVRVVATEDSVRLMGPQQARETRQFRMLFGDDVEEPGALPEPLEGDVIVLEGHELRVVEVGQADAASCSVLHVPSLDAVVAGDVVYNKIHQMLATTGPAEWDGWIASVDAVERLGPRLVVAGHKAPDARDDDADRILDETRSYIRDFRAASEQADSVAALVEAMQAKYPDHGNLTTLRFSAQAALKSRA